MAEPDHWHHTAALSATGTERALDWLDTLAGRQGWPGHCRQALRLGIDEWLANLRRHAGLEGQTCQLHIRADDDTIMLEIIDHGAAFNPLAQPPATPAPRLEDTRIGGHGLRLLHHSFDALAYERRLDCNHLRLTTRRRPTGDGT